MKHLLSKALITLFVTLCLISFGAFKKTAGINYIKTAGITPVDSFQIYVRAYSRIKSTTKKKSELKKLLTKLRNYTLKINGSKSVVFQNVTYHIFVANLDSDEIQLHLYKPGADKANFFSFGALKTQLEVDKRQPLMITNAGMFTPEYEPEGLYIEENSKIFFPLDTGKSKPNANFYLKPNGVFYIDASNIPHIDSTEKLGHINEKELKKFKLATQSGPMLVINGSIHKAFKYGSKNLKTRSGVGLISGNKKKIVFALTINGTNFYDFASFFREIFNCENALFLDGSISQMYLHDLSPKELDGDFGPLISVCRKTK